MEAGKRASEFLAPGVHRHRNFGFSKFRVSSPTGVRAPDHAERLTDLPRELLAGPNHRVEERVYNDGYINRYTVLSKFGD